jgi:hypothetical protein
MSVEEKSIQQFAAQLDQEAPPISIAEIEQRAATTSAGLHGGAAPPDRRRWAPVVLAVAVVIVAIAGVVLALPERSPTPTLRTGETVELGTVAAPPTQPATSVPSPPGATAPPSEETASDPTVAAPTTLALPPRDVSLDGDTESVLAAIDADRIDKLRELDGFTATVRQQTETLRDDGSPIETQSGFGSRTTLLADGSMWTELDGGGFASYDAATGESRGAIPMPTGDTYYQLIEGWTDNSTGLSIMLGSDPARLLSDATQMSTVVIEETIHDQRAAWSIRTTMDVTISAVDPDASPQTETFVVDQATGLIVASSLEWQASPQERIRRTSELVDLELTDAMPAQFPGQFPDGAQIDRSGDPAAYRPATLSDAAEWFGPGFVAPPEVPVGTTIFLAEYEGETGNPQSVRSRNVEIRAREGFATLWTVFLSTDVPGSGGSIPDGQLLVDGTLCRDVDDDGTCDVLPSDSEPIANTAVADFSVYDAPPFLTLERNGIRVSVTGSSVVDARSVAESFVAW